MHRFRRGEPREKEGGLKKRALIVDDERVMRQVLEEALADTHECSVVCDGREAYRLAGESGRYDLIVMDLAMADWDGVSSISLIEAMNPQCRIIVVSGRIAPQEREQLSQFGCVRRVMKKPLSIKEFLEAVDEVENPA